MSSIPKVRPNTPYVYLAKNEGNNNVQGEYLLFIQVPVDAGYGVSFPNDINGESNPNYMDTTTKYTCSIVPDGSTAAKKVSKLVVLNPSSAPDAGFDQAIYEVEVSVINPRDIVRKTTVHYADADAASNLTIVNEKALNCPYLYLTNPEAEFGGNKNIFSPRCLIPINTGVDMVNQSLVSQVPAGVFEENVTLIGTFTTNAEVDANNLQCNNSDYVDPAPILGLFSVIVNSSQGISRQGKLRNKSSDTNPNSFIDL